ncbi:hypothetical protein HYPSUDRAFT_599031 [Hypholoma sublateritium FD-334 SS-4]|uniref:MYND-type domain-containing protein n=1 Tax=Hypholoma sublateritium (strain FD-334 SS-4) TaxID=945553 RepID=A0A0D2N1H0_HYPSF|nr:hypothetical protein HYPSUDRAFT_599031 [Hypholoma sublateritium FD-334 SS-4]
MANTFRAVLSGMSERRCEQCENCLKHVESVLCGRATKNCNKRHTPVLLTCAQCKEVRYCSRTCQRAQWKEHKTSCLSHTRMLTVIKLLGPRIEQTFKAFSKFSQAISGYLEIPAISALELHKGKHRVSTHPCLFAQDQSQRDNFLRDREIYPGSHHIQD